MKDLTIRQRIALSLSFVLLLMVVMGAVSLMRLANVEEATNALLASSLPGLYNRTQTLAAWEENYATTAGYTLHDDPASLAEDQRQLAVNWDKLDQLSLQYEPMVDTPEEKEMIGTYTNLLLTYKRMQADIIKAAEAKNDRAARTKLLTDLDPVFDKAESVLKKLEDFNRAAAERSTQQIMTAVSSARSSVYLSAMLALAVTLLSGFLLVRSVTRSGNRVSASVVDIAATAKQQEATASEMAATTTEIGSTSHEISATSKALVRTMNEVSAMTEQSAALAGVGQTGLSHMEEAMRHVTDAAASVSSKLGVLNEKAGRSEERRVGKEC